MVWRAGQNRRLDMILRWGKPLTATLKSRSAVLVGGCGCGVGMYVKALLPHSDAVAGIDIEAEHLALAGANVPGARFTLAAGEHLPYPDNCFDLVLSHEVLEHVQDDRLAVAEMVRVLRPGGRAVIFVPNRLYPFETHGHYWRGLYHFGNTPLINYLPDPLRNRLAPHVRAYTRQRAARPVRGPARARRAPTQIYPGYDNLVVRAPCAGQVAAPHHLCRWNGPR